MKILRYTTDIQKKVGSKVKAEPWLHIGFTDDGHYGIWIWDTRQIVGTGNADGSKIEGEQAKDNHKPLTGEHADAFKFKGDSNASVNPNEPLVLVSPAGYNDTFACSYPTRTAKLKPWSQVGNYDGMYVFNPNILFTKQGDPFGENSIGHSGGDYAPCELVYDDDIDANERQKLQEKFLKDCPTVSEINKYRGRWLNFSCGETDAQYWGDDKPQPKPFNGFDKYGYKVSALQAK